MTTRQNLIIRIGETWSFSYVHLSDGAPVDLTGYTARMAIKPNYGGSIHAYLSTGSDAIGGTIALGGVSGKITLSMSSADTDNIMLSVYMDRSGKSTTTRLIYDLELVSASGTVDRALEGIVEIVRSVTK